jgi:trans-aconitate methyltransferase
MSSSGRRRWQNWDVGDAVEKIDHFWRNSAGEREFRAVLARDIGATCGRGIPLFEVGCGSGLIGKELVDQGVLSAAQYSGGDVSQSMLVLARQRLPGAKLVELDVLDLTLPKQDNVLCLQVLQHLPHYREGLAQLLNFARKQLYLVTWFGDLSYDDQIILSRDSEAKPTFFTNRYSLARFMAQIRECGRPITSLSEYALLGETRAVHVVFT